MQLTSLVISLTAAQYKSKLQAPNMPKLSDYVWIKWAIVHI